MGLGLATPLHTCTHNHTHARTHVRMHACMYAHARTLTCAYRHKASTHICTCASMYRHTHTHNVYMHVYTHACTNTHKQIHMHARKHTQCAYMHTQIHTTFMYRNLAISRDENISYVIISCSFNFVRSPYRIRNTCENFIVEKYSYVQFSYGRQRTKLNRVRNKTKLRYEQRSFRALSYRYNYYTPTCSH